MQRALFFLLFALSFSSCKKAIDNAKENAVIKIMVSGQWTITKFTQGNTTITEDFSAYKFQFHKNQKVDALKNGVIAYTGTWSGDAAAYSVTTDFGASGYPIFLLNGTFKITDAGEDYVEAEATVNGEARTLWMKK